MKRKTLSDFNLLDLGSTIVLGGTAFIGNGHLYIAPFDVDNLEGVEVDYLTLDTEDWQKVLRQLDIVETEIIQHGPNGITKAVVRKSQRIIEGRISWEVFARDNYHCRYCYKTATPLSVDHVDLWEEGGASQKENLVTACKPCNRKRGNTSYDTWIASPTYKQLSARLPLEVREQNEALVQQLPYLKTLRRTMTRSR